MLANSTSASMHLSHIFVISADWACYKTCSVWFESFYWTNESESNLAISDNPTLGKLILETFSRSTWIVPRDHFQPIATKESWVVNKPFLRSELISMIRAVNIMSHFVLSVSNKVPSSVAQLMRFKPIIEPTNSNYTLLNIALLHFVIG